MSHKMNTPKLLIFDKNSKNERTSLLHQKVENWRHCNLTHAKRILQGKGILLDGSNQNCPREDTIFFHGEWEAAAKAFVSDNGRMISHIPVDSSPTAAQWEQNYNADSNDETWDKRHNTDPYFSDEQFFYANCSQRPEAENLRLKRIPDGSIIVFGEFRRCGTANETLILSDFLVELVFVVRDSLLYSPAELTALYNCDPTAPAINYKGRNIPSRFIRASTLPLHYYSSKYRKGIFRLYFGALYSSSSRSMFSYFPCKTEPFEQLPAINIKRFLPAGYVGGTSECSLAPGIWNEIRGQIQAQGFGLGVKYHNVNVLPSTV